MSLAVRLIRRPMCVVASAGPMRCMSTGGHIRDAGGSFAKRGASEEERYVWEHEKQAIQKLRDQLRQKEQEAHKKLEANPKLDPEFQKELKELPEIRLQARAGGDAFSRRESAAEERYIRQHEREVADAAKTKGKK
ncbi:hypothetical protein HDU85_007465 [Gaertneriomyces sp. JEL0708]|nr:hypothetical protein HDU85_007465 [Gaertneriomyces sp. JEL0708]